mmetsp:Transcript_106263/g.288365  ORF Transcript_106263/g.288365 Transcript_106263/m.288365 type:complete len:209 (-) Transcript_106263:2-628(-)
MAWPASGWFMSRVASFSSSAITLTGGEFSCWACSSAPTSTSGGSLSRGTLATRPSSRCPNIGLSLGNTISFDSPTAMPSTPASICSKTSFSPTTNSSGPSFSVVTNTSPLSTSVPVYSICARTPGSARSGAAARGARERNTRPPARLAPPTHAAPATAQARRAARATQKASRPTRPAQSPRGRRAGMAGAPEERAWARAETKAGPKLS